MFGMGFGEILLIAVVAILFLGPDKLPGAMVEIAKFMKSAKKALTDAKNTFNDEVNVAELKEEALRYKAKLDEATEELEGFRNLNPMNELTKSTNSVKDNFAALTQRPTETVTTQVEPKQKEIVFKKKTVTQSTLDEVKKENESSHN